MLLLAVLLLLVGGSATAGDWDYRGYGDTRWRYRSDGREDDQDLSGALVLDGRGEAAALHLHAALTHDLEGLAPRGEYERFGGLTDGFSDRTHGYLYSAHLDLAGRGRRLRLGRQWSYRGETLHFDGASLEHDLGGHLRLALLGGVPVHLYESSPSGDHVAGGGLRMGGIGPVEVGASYYRLRDTRDGPGRLARRVDDDLTVLDAAVRTRALTATGEASYDGDRVRRLRGRTRLALEELGLRLGGSVVYQPETLEDLVTEASPFYRVLGDSKPYQVYGVDLEQDLRPGVTVVADGTVRILRVRSDRSAFNHDYGRYRLGLRLEPEVCGVVAVAVGGDLWEAEEGPDRRGGYLDLERGLGASWTLSAGTDYALYRYDRITGVEREDVRSYHLRLRRRVPKGPNGGMNGGIGVDLGAELEDTGIGTYRSFEVGLRREF